jgi:hypothetical protein
LIFISVSFGWTIIIFFSQEDDDDDVTIENGDCGFDDDDETLKNKQEVIELPGRTHQGERERTLVRVVDNVPIEK